MTPDDPLSGREAAVLALARGLPVTRAADQAGISRRTLTRWRQDPDFGGEVREARRRLVDETAAALEDACRAAITTLTDALTDDHPAIRVRAASTLLTARTTYTDSADLAARVEALEAVLKERHATPQHRP